MKKCGTIILSLFIVLKMDAQQTLPAIAGEYYLRGVMETASGFKLDTDSTFQFFFSYGALDRFGQGNWSVKNGEIVLNSKNRPGPDFALANSKIIKDDFISIRVIEKNPIFLSGVYCRLKSGGKLFEEVSNKEGYIKFPKMPVDSLTLIFEFCPERSSVFTIANPNHNYFEFGFESWMMEVFFENFMLHPLDSLLIGKHPLLDGISYNYKKTK